jgi:hypothetical protein
MTTLFFSLAAAVLSAIGCVLLDPRPARATRAIASKQRGLRPR